MLKMNLQLFGGRGSAGGNNPAGRVDRDVRQATSENDISDRIREVRELQTKASAERADRKNNSDERNLRELARVERENRLSGSADLVKGATYEVDWNGKTRTGEYVRGDGSNGIPTRVFRDTKTGKLFAVDNDEIRNTVRRKR